MESLSSVFPLLSGLVMLVGVWITFRTIMRGLRRDESDEGDIHSHPLLRDLAKGTLLTAAGLLSTLALTGSIHLWTDPLELFVPLLILISLLVMAGIFLHMFADSKIEDINVIPLKIAEDEEAKEKHKESIQPSLRPWRKLKTSCDLLVMACVLMSVSYALLVLMPYLLKLDPWIGIIGSIVMTLIVGWQAIDGDD